MNSLDICALGLGISGLWGYLICIVMLYQILTDENKDSGDYKILFGFVIPTILLLTSDYVYIILRLGKLI